MGKLGLPILVTNIHTGICMPETSDVNTKVKYFFSIYFLIRVMVEGGLLYFYVDSNVFWLILFRA